jgi:hypothetical protein
MDALQMAGMLFVVSAAVLLAREARERVQLLTAETLRR